MRRAAVVLPLLPLAAACGTGEAAVFDAVAARRAVAAFECPSDLDLGVAPVELDGRRLSVLTTVAPITSIVANVAGDAADVTGLVPEGVSSHTFEPRPSAAEALAAADLLLGNGLRLEDPVLALADRRLRDGVSVVELGSHAVTAEQHLYDESFPVEGGAPNPHLWTNPPMGRCYALLAGEALAAADPANAATYERNAARFAAKVDALDRAMLAASSTVPEAHRALLTYHDAWAYFAARYGWDVIGAIQPSSFAEPSAKDVVALVEQVEETRVPAIFGSEVFPSPVLARIGEETGVRYVDVLRDDDLPGRPGDPEHSYLGLLRFDLVTIVRNLGGDPSALEAVDVADVVEDRASYPQ